MNQAFWTEERVTGSLLVSGLLIGLLAAVIMIVNGAASGFAAVGGALAAMAPYADTFRLLNEIYSVTWIFPLLGFALLARLLARAGEEQQALLAFTLALVTGLTGILHGAFHVGLTTWAAEEAGRTESIPEIYPPLRDATDGAFRLGYAGSFVAMILIGWGILRTGLLPPSLGLAAIGWSTLCFAGWLVGVGAPAIPFIMPAAIGVALLWP
ncbi:MAG TPA: hypothetical protein PLK31_01440 [Chloroflexota bacterium]|nr:hypothetical protein [Chloroflexota bacterium]